MKIAKSKDLQFQTNLDTPEQLFCDGGVVGENRAGAADAGTFAARWVRQGQPKQDTFGYILPQDVLPDCTISNNVTELLAIIRGLQMLPDGWSGVVWSDSKISLGRVFAEWSICNIPEWMLVELSRVKQRLDWAHIQYGLLDGHPTQEQLAAGVGKRGHPVSKHNMWCDWQCGQIAKELRKNGVVNV